MASASMTMLPRRIMLEAVVQTFVHSLLDFIQLHTHVGKVPQEVLDLSMLKTNTRPI